MYKKHTRLENNLIFLILIIIVIMAVYALLSWFPPSSQGSSTYNIYTNQLNIESFKLINKDRSLYNRLPIKHSQKLNKLANIRVHQIEHHFSHYSRSDYPMTTIDATKAHLPKGFKGSENIATEGIGKVQTIGDSHVFNNHNGIDMAKMTNSAMMFHDQIENNGHRKNILNSDNTLVGIGTAYDSKSKNYYLVEDFGNHNDNSSEDVNHVSFDDHIPQIKSNKIDHKLFRFFKREVNYIIYRSKNYYPNLPDILHKQK